MSNSIGAPSAAHVALALVALSLTDGVLAVGGLPLIVRVLGIGNVRSHQDSIWLARAERYCHAVRRAGVLYPRHARCLQSAVAAVILLRLRGVHAKLVIGVRRMPFAAHAWVEVQRHVVLNGDERGFDTYTVITRC